MCKSVCQTSAGRGLQRLLIGGLLLATLGTIGCQSDFSGQTLPSPYYLLDDVQYFPPGPEFKLAREAAAMKAYREEQALRNNAAPPPAGVPAALPPGVPAGAPADFPAGGAAGASRQHGIPRR